jgi:hypothetical protein
MPLRAEEQPLKESAPSAWFVTVRSVVAIRRHWRERMMDEGQPIANTDRPWDELGAR